MNKKNIVTIAGILLSAAVILFIAGFILNQNKTLVSPGVKKVTGQPAAESATVPTSRPIPQTPAYDPPKEIRYNVSTDLKLELETINPQVNDSDFE